MSAFTDPKCHLEGNKLLVNLMLKVPIEIELELSQKSPTEYHQLSSQEVHNQRDNFEEMTIKDKLSQSNSVENLLISSTELKQIVAKAIENNPALSSLSFAKYENQKTHSEDNSLKYEQIDRFRAEESNIPHELVTSLSEYEDQENYSEDNLLNYEEIKEEIEEFYPQESNTSTKLITTKFDKQSVAHVVDLFNDGIVFTINAIGVILFLGKIANYSWEGDSI